MEPTPFVSTGYKPPIKKDPRNFPLEKAQPVVPFPSSYKTDISSIPVMMQGKLPDCVENGIVFVKKYHDYKNTGVIEDLSRRFLAIKTTAADGFPFTDGTNVETALKVAYSTGICESTLLADDHTLDEPTFIGASITQAMLDNAATHKISSYAFLTDTSANGLKNAIYQNGVVVIGIEIDQSWWTATNGNVSWDKADILPIRPPTGHSTTTDPSLSGHCVVLYGYDEQYFYFVNEWSTDWGDNGTGYFSANDLPFIYEAGTIVDLAPEVVSQLKQANQLVNTIDQLQVVENPQNKALITNLISTLWKSFLALFNS